MSRSIVAAIVGDIAPGDGVSKTEKNRRETAAMEQIRDLLGVNSFAGSSQETTLSLLLSFQRMLWTQ